MHASKLGAFFRLTRIEHSIMLVIAVFAGEFIVLGRFPSLYYLILSAVVPIFISMGSFAINDYFDVKVDKANKKFDRPLVSGAISKNAALSIAAISFMIGVFASAFINLYAFVIALVFAGFAAFYAFKLKEVVAVGNLYIAAAMAIPFLFGNYVVSASLNPIIIIISFTVVLSGFAREIHGTIRDYKGDRKIRNIKNIPYYIGIKSSAIFALLLYIIAIILSFYLFAAHIPGQFYMNLFYLFAILVVDIMLVWVGAVYISKKVSNKRYMRLARNISLLAMALALIIYLLANFVYFAV